MVGGPPHSGSRVGVGFIVGVGLGAGVVVPWAGEFTGLTTWRVAVGGGKVGGRVGAWVGREREGPRGLFQVEARRVANTNPATSNTPRKAKRAGFPHFGKDFM